MNQNSEEQYTEEQKRYREEIEKKHGKTPEQLYEEREKRVREAIELKEPDRVPTSIRLTYFPATYLGLPKSTAYYQPCKWKHAVLRTMLDFDPDMSASFAGIISGEVNDILRPTQSRWPGGPLPDDSSHQAIDVETMKADEYELLMTDPTGFFIRKQLPRMYEALKPLEKLPPLGGRGRGIGSLARLFKTEEFKEMGRALIAAGEAQERFQKDMGTTLAEDMEKLCLMTNGTMGGAGGIPFDSLSDFYRGMHGSMMDMYRQPDMMIALFDKLQAESFKRAVPANPNVKPNPKRVGAGMHRGTDGFLSKEQFEKFYWPYMKKTMLKSIELGYVPVPFVEGQFDSRIEYFLELPKGKFVVLLDQSDIIRAKEILRDHACIMGNLQPSLLQLGTPDDVDEHCKKLIKIVGKDGGFILSHGSSLDEAKPENVRAMMDSVQKYQP